MALIFIDSMGQYDTSASDFQNNYPNNRFMNASWAGFGAALGPWATPYAHTGWNANTGGTFFGFDLRAASGQGPLAGGGVWGERMWFEDTSGGAYGILGFFDGTLTNAQFTLQRDSNGTVNLRRGDGAGTIIASSAAGAIKSNQSGFLEVKWDKIDSSTANMGVWWTDDATGTETKIITAANCNNQGSTGTAIGGVAHGGWTDCQDVYLLDLTGPAPWNDRLGACAVVCITMSANDSVMYTPQSSTNAAMVGGAISGSNWTSSTAANDQDTFSVASTIPTSTVVYAVQARSLWQQTSAGGGTVANIVKSGGITVAGANFTPPSSGYTYRLDLFPTDPSTAAQWTMAGVLAAKYGYKTVSRSAGTLKCFQARVEVLIRNPRPTAAPSNAGEPAIVQSAFARGNSGSVSVVLGTAPTAGNTLLFFDLGNAGSSTKPSGLTNVQATADDAYNQVLVYSRTVVAGDGATWTWTGLSDWHNLAVFEIAGLTGLSVAHGAASLSGNRAATSSLAAAAHSYSKRLLLFENDVASEFYFLVGANYTPLPTTLLSPANWLHTATGNHNAAIYQSDPALSGVVSLALFNQSRTVWCDLLLVGVPAVSGRRRRVQLMSAG